MSLESEIAAGRTIVQIMRLAIGVVYVLFISPAIDRVAKTFSRKDRDDTSIEAEEVQHRGSR